MAIEAHYRTPRGGSGQVLTCVYSISTRSSPPLGSRKIKVTSKTEERIGIASANGVPGMDSVNEWTAQGLGGYAGPRQHGLALST